MTSGKDLASRIRNGDVRALARALSMVENGAPEAASLLHQLYPVVPPHMTIGVTGPPGAGKSTLLDHMIGHYRSLKARVGVIAVDPSSPFSGGALLADRIRMQSHATDPGVFIRSMGSRGHLGGLSGASRDAALLLASSGCDPVILETVGVGQAEVEIAELADVTVLVLVPGAGDDVQAMKAGIMEIGDLIVLNKADRPGIDHLESAVSASLELIPEGRARPQVVRVSAATRQGLDDLWTALDALVSGADSGARRLENARRTLQGIIAETGRLLGDSLLKREYGSEEKVMKQITKGVTTPYEVGRVLARAGERMLAGDENPEN